LALSLLLSPPRGARSPRAPLDARSSDFGISCIYEGHFKAEMRGFPTSHLRASSDAVECNRGQRQVGPQPSLQPHDRAYNSTTVQISSKSKKGLQGELNPEPQEAKPRLQPQRRHPRSTHRNRGARSFITHASDVPTPPADTARRLRPPTPPADATWLMRRTAVFGTAPLPVSLAKLGISTASRQLSKVTHVPASRQLSEVRHQHRFPSASTASRQLSEVRHQHRFPSA
jgi:hypothetical protein